MISWRMRAGPDPKPGCIREVHGDGLRSLGFGGTPGMKWDGMNAAEAAEAGSR